MLNLKQNIRPRGMHLDSKRALIPLASILLGLSLLSRVGRIWHWAPLLAIGIAAGPVFFGPALVIVASWDLVRVKLDCRTILGVILALLASAVVLWDVYTYALGAVH